MQVALKSCRQRVDAGYQAWQYIMRTYKAIDDLYISQLEKKLTNIRMGGARIGDRVLQSSATSFGQFADDRRRLLGGVVCHSYHPWPPSGYNLMRRMLTVPGTREALNEDSLSSHIIQDEFMQESERPAELLPQAKYVAPAKQGRQQGQRGKSAGGGGGNSSKAPTAGSRRKVEIAAAVARSDDDRDANRRKGEGGHRRRDNQPRKEKQASKTSSTKNGDSSGGNARGEEASCSMVGVVEPTISLALEASEDFKVVAVL
ncbi:unnamed protein product [Closterium sp. NIES-54]